MESAERYLKGATTMTASQTKYADETCSSSRCSVQLHQHVVNDITAYIWFPAHWTPFVLRQFQHKEGEYRAANLS